MLIIKTKMLGGLAGGFLPPLKPLEELDFPFLLVFFACAVTFLVDVVVAVRRTLAPHVLRNISIDFTMDTLSSS